MICLDTNYLIGGITKDAKEAEELVKWIQLNELLVTPMPAWYEFLCGPVSIAQVMTIRSFISDILPFTEVEAQEAARIFNATGRKRSLRVDCMIAATAMMAGAKLATNNVDDFKLFLPLGLEMIRI